MPSSTYATPLLITGSRGDGKTTLLPEKTKTIPGNINYFSLSKYFVDHAEQLYYSNYFKYAHQEDFFLSLNDYLARLQIALKITGTLQPLKIMN
ncbi:MAG TPA: hypothetical protein PKD90_03745 [Phnomibacter sp.]|nr:hypothetical protein [Phnomibacter sp.]